MLDSIAYIQNLPGEIIIHIVVNDQEVTMAVEQNGKEIASYDRLRSWNNCSIEEGFVSLDHQCLVDCAEKDNDFE